MVDEDRIKGMISDFAKIYNSSLENPAHISYSEWPKSFEGEDFVIASRICRYVSARNSRTSTAIWRISSFIEKELLEDILSNLSYNPLHKS